MSAFALRLVITALIFLLGVVIEIRGGSPYSERELTALWTFVISGFGLTLVYTSVLKYGPRSGLPRLEVTCDGILITFLVYCTGGAHSLFGFLFVIWIVHAAVRSGHHSAIVSAAAATVVFGAISLGPAYGWLPAFEAGDLSPPDEAIRAVGMHTLAFLGVAFLAHHLAREVRVQRAELFEMGELQRRIMDNVPSGLLTVDPHGRITSFNREAERITGAPAPEVLGRPLEEVIPGLLSAGPECGGADISRSERGFVNREGEELYLGYSRSALRDDRGRAEGHVLIFQDLTRVIEMEEQLRRSETLSAVGQLAAGLAHEIRNPLASLSGALELLANDLPGRDASSRRLMRIVQRETERLDRLVQDFLDYARPGPRRLAEVDVGELLREIRVLLAGGRFGGIDLAVRVPPELRVRGDADQLRQVFWNLVLNAAESGPAPQQVRVEGRHAAPDEAMAEIMVADGGEGIPGDLLERIFEPFFTTRPKGTGLGLATVHRVVEAHGGQVRVRSRVGEGTSVHVLLPEVRS